MVSERSAMLIWIEIDRGRVREVVDVIANDVVNVMGLSSASANGIAIGMMSEMGGEKGRVVIVGMRGGRERMIGGEIGRDLDLDRGGAIGQRIVLGELIFFL